MLVDQRMIVGLVPRSSAFQEQWEQLFPWLGREIYGEITAWNVGASLALLVLTGLVHLILRLVIGRHLRLDRQRREGEPEHERDFRRWFDLILEATVAPLAVVVWVYGSYLALSFLLLPYQHLEEPPIVLRLLDWVQQLTLFAVFIWLIFRTIRVVDVRLCQRARRTQSKWDNILAPLVGRTLRSVLPLVVLILSLPLLEIAPEGYAIVRNTLSVTVIVFIAAVLFQAVRAIEEGVLLQFRIDVEDNLQARKLHTQVTVLKKVAYVVIGIFALASILMVFESLRQLGTSILASAGIAGIIIGFAAQRSLGTLLAGFQIAITQPIRLDDVVIVEGEWGRIEEIALTYVVVRIWDLRRLVLPIQYFIEKPFQNWTRTSAEILGSVFFYVDYTVPVQAIREAFEQALENSPKWNRKVQVLQVTDAKERTVELRALMSAANASIAWDLRCEVREKMIEFIRDNYPEALPRFRAELSGPGLLPAGREGEA